MRLFLALTLAAVSAVSAQNRRPDYLAAVRAYVAGAGLEAHLSTLSQWEHRDFDDAVRALIVTKDKPRIEAAAVFQIELAIASIGISREFAKNHLELGERLIESLRPTPSEARENPDRLVEFERLASLWLGVAGSVFLKESEIALAEPWISRAVRMRRDSAHLKTLAGTLEEMRAATFHPEWIVVSNRQTRMILERQRHLMQARDLFEQAIELDSAYAPAHIHLGRVQFLDGKLPQARAAIERGIELATDHRHRYLGALFLGGILQAQKDVAGARQAYERALTLAPAAQTASVALAYLELMHGSPDRARTIVDTFAQVGRQDVDWWEYVNGGVDLHGLERLRSRVLQ